ncbi:hypothetical protein FBY10_1327, partial [Pseudomonas sp. SJZ103]
MRITKKAVSFRQVGTFPVRQFDSRF